MSNFVPFDCERGSVSKNQVKVSQHFDVVCYYSIVYKANEKCYADLCCFIQNFKSKIQISTIKGTFLYSVFGTVQSALHFTPGRPVHSNAISTSLVSIQPCCNYWPKTICFDIDIHLHL